MQRTVVCVLCAGLLYAQNARAQESERETPKWVYLVSAGVTAVMGSIWYYNTFVKPSRLDPEEKLKQRARAEIRYLASAGEYAALQKLETSTEIHEFMNGFWRKRDPNPATVENEFEQLYMERIEYVNAHFADHREGWETDRGRAYLLYGPPDEIDRLPWTQFSLQDFGVDIKALEAWLYFRPATGVEFPSVFSDYQRGMAKFIFADWEGAGSMAQIYSSEKGERCDSRVFAAR